MPQFPHLYEQKDHTSAYLKGCHEDYMSQSTSKAQRTTNAWNNERSINVTCHYTCQVERVLTPEWLSPLLYSGDANCPRLPSLRG